MNLRPLLLASVLLGVAFAGCADDNSGGTAPTTGTPGAGTTPTGATPSPTGATPTRPVTATTPATGGRTYTVVTDAAFPPFEEIDANGTFVGYDIDVMREVARRAGWTVNFQNMGFEALLLSVQNGQVDMAISAITIRADRSEVMDFSIAYYEANQSVSMRSSDTRTFSSIADLRGKGLSFGVQGATTAVEFVEKEFVDKNDGTLKRYDTYPLALQALKNNDVDVVVMDEPAQRQAALSDPAVKVAFEFSTGESYGIAMPKGRTQLLNQVNDALEAMHDDGTLATLKAKWGI